MKTENTHTAKKYTVEIDGINHITLIYITHYSYLKTFWGLYIVHVIQEVAIIVNHVFTLYSLC